jgi:hypothetical protein
MQAPGRIVAWVGMPAFTDAGLAAAAGRFNAIFADEAAKRPWVRYVDTSSITPDGPDGAHFGLSGAAAVANLIAAVLWP